MVQTIELIERASIRGRTTPHEIDVWWVFRLLNGATRAVAFQCRDWRNRIKQEHLYAFKAILEDIPGSPHGVYVTRTGYQKGARTVASVHGITVWELRQPAQSDWEGRVRDIVLQIKTASPSFKNPCIAIPEEADYPDEGVVSGFACDMRLIDAGGAAVATLEDIHRQLAPEGFDRVDWTTRSWQPRVPTYLSLDDGRRVRVVGYSVDVRQTVHETESRIRGDEVVAFIVRDAVSGGVSTLSPSLGVRAGGELGDTLGIVDQ